VTVGPLSVGVKAAREAALKVIGSVAGGADPIRQAKADRLAEQRRVVLSGALVRYENHIMARKLVNARDNMSLLRRGLASLMSHSISQVTLRDIADCIDVFERQRRFGAAQELRKHTSAFLNWARGQGLIVYNPIAGWRRERPSRAEWLDRREHGRVLTPHEIRAYVHACIELRKDKDNDPKLADYSMLLLLTGQRRGETAAMRRQDIVVESESVEWRIPAGRSKNARAHRVPLTKTAFEMISAQPAYAAGDFIFAGRGRHGELVPMSGWSKRLTKLNKEIRRQLESTAEAMRQAVTECMNPRPRRRPGEAEVAAAESAVRDYRDIGWHDVRRTFRSGLAELGVEEVVAERMINHAPAALLRIYDRSDRWDERVAAATAWEAHVTRVSAPDRPFAPAPSKRVVRVAAEVDADSRAGRTDSVGDADEMARRRWNVSSGRSITSQTIARGRRKTRAMREGLKLQRGHTECKEQ
jgi:integrase